MTPEERRRAGAAIRSRLADLGMTIDQLADKADLHPSTVRAAINGTRWPHPATREAISTVLGWKVGDLARRALGAAPVRDASSTELLDELCRRRARIAHPR